MGDKIKILFYSSDNAGVFYYRINMPAKHIEKHYSDVFDVSYLNVKELSRKDIIEYISSFDILYYSKILFNDVSLINKIKEKGKTKIVLDIDDYWHVDKKNVIYDMYSKNNLHIKLMKNIQIADYVITTTDFLKNKIIELTKRDNVFVFPNSIDVDLMTQFKDNRVVDDNNLVRIGYMGGSSHHNDVLLLRGVVNMLLTNKQTKDKFKIILGGWDYFGEKTVKRLNNDLEKELIERKIWTREMFIQIQNSDGKINNVSLMPYDLVAKYAHNFIKETIEKIKPEETAYYVYENILTDNMKLIKNKSYLNWLKTYEVNGKYYDEEQYGRRWTKPVNSYANLLNECDIVLAPLENNLFNNCKSNLKQVEAYTRKLPVVCSDVIPYNVDGVSYENCILIPDKQNQAKYWFKALKNLILNPDLREKLGNNLYDDFSKKYDLNKINIERTSFLKSIV